MKDKAIICDIDGCLLDVSKLYKEIHSRHLIGQEMWDFFHKNANNPEYATKIKEVFELLNSLDCKIILLTARRDLIAKSTLHYLLEGKVKLNNISQLIVRSEELEGIPSHIFKKAELLKLKEQYDIQVVIDDEYTNCATFKEMGFTVLRVLRKDNADKNE